VVRDDDHVSGSGRVDRGRAEMPGSGGRLTGLGLITAGVLLSWHAAVFFIAQGAIAGATLEVINYIEHYGLHRRELGNGRYERVDHRHSWNSNYRLTNWMLFQLQRHADHHANARRRYQVLRHFDDSPQLPAGYATMFLVALVPPLWQRVIDPRVRRYLVDGGMA
jgi:alkane 1-monooxygenase